MSDSGPAAIPALDQYLENADFASEDQRASFSALRAELTAQVVHARQDPLMFTVLPRTGGSGHGGRIGLPTICWPTRFLAGQRSVYLLAHAAKIPIADDEPNIREVITFALERAGFATITARNGSEALQQVLRTG